MHIKYLIFLQPILFAFDLLLKVQPKNAIGVGREAKPVWGLSRGLN